MILLGWMLLGLGIRAEDITSGSSAGNETTSSSNELAGFYQAVLKEAILKESDNLESSATQLQSTGHNTLYVNIHSSGQETFTPSQVKNIEHNIYWDASDIPTWADFTQGYVKIIYDTNVCSVVSVTPGIFDTWISSRGSNYVILWTWQIGNVPLINNPSAVAFTVRFQGTASGGTTNLTYDITSSSGVHRGWFWAGQGAHNWFQVSAQVRFAPQIQPPVAPGNLVANTVSPHQIDLSWEDNSDNEQGSYVERKIGEYGAYVQIAALGADSTTYNDIGLTASTLYYYRVRAYNAGGNSDYSNETSATTPPELPAAPSNLVATAVSASQINLTWQDNSDNEDGFIIETKINCFADFVQIATVNADTDSYSDKRVLSGILHSYRVRAYNEAGNSDYSNIASATTPTPMEYIISILNEFYQAGAIKNQGIYNSLLVKLQAAQNAQNPNVALGQLNAFSNHVQAQSGKGITVEASQFLLALNEALMDYVNTEKTASGYALIATFKPADYNSVAIEVLETPEPYEPVGSFIEVDGYKFYEDSREYVGETTPGVLNLYYTDNFGQCIHINKTIEINNTTKVIYYNGIPTTNLKDIFGGLYPVPAGEYMFLLMDFPYWYTIFIKPGIHCQIQPQIPKFKTDKGRDIKVKPPATPDPGPEIRAELKKLHHLEKEAQGLTPTIFSPITPTQVLRPGVITPTCILPTKTYNCHGWTFACTSGRIGDSSDVGKIILDNGYTLITPTKLAPAKPGDVVVYRDAQGEITHTGIVREVDPNTGQPILIESKWGDFERYKHPPDKVPETYLPKDNPTTPQNEGGTIEYWRAPDTRQAPPGSTDPDKDRHTLKNG